jgi:hypothetical protein
MGRAKDFLRPKIKKLFLTAKAQRAQRKISERIDILHLSPAFALFAPLRLTFFSLNEIHDRKKTPKDLA